MTSKPWLKAKTAGEAYGIAFWEFGKGSSTHLSIGQVQANALQAVIEWHEAQRERMSEHWEVRSFKRDGVGQWVIATYSTREDAMVRKHNECVAKDYAVTVVHVTRYRRKKA